MHLDVHPDAARRHLANQAMCKVREFEEATFRAAMPPPKPPSDERHAIPDLVLSKERCARHTFAYEEMLYREVLCCHLPAQNRLCVLPAYSIECLNGERHLWTVCVR